MRHTLTTKKNKAKCLAYRNGKRCNRIARAVITFTSHSGYHRQSVCKECAGRKDAIIVQESSSGFNVRVVGFGMQSREYIAC